MVQRASTKRFDAWQRNGAKTIPAYTPRYLQPLDDWKVFNNWMRRFEGCLKAVTCRLDPQLLTQTPETFD